MSRFDRVHSSSKTGYSSEFDGAPRRRKDPFNFSKPKHHVHGTGHTHGSSGFNEAVSKSARAADRVRSNAYQRHLDFIKHYAHNYGDQSMKKYTCLSGDGVKTDWDVLAEEHRFVRTPEEDELAKKNWGKRLAKRYYDKLFKEYALADMRLYKKGQVGLRWRTQKEVVHGKGQFECGSLHCSEPDGLESFEVNFSYQEGDPPQRKNTLVKLRLCPGCAYKLNYRKMKAEKKRAKKQLRKELRRAKRKRPDVVANSHSHTKHQKRAQQDSEGAITHAHTNLSKQERKDTDKLPHTDHRKKDDTDTNTNPATAHATATDVNRTAKTDSSSAHGAAPSSVWTAPKGKEKDAMDLFLDSLMP